MAIKISIIVEIMLSLSLNIFYVLYGNFMKYIMIFYCCPPVGSN
jgi:hypothetical protein